MFALFWCFGEESVGFGSVSLASVLKTFFATHSDSQRNIVLSNCVLSALQAVGDIKSVFLGQENCSLDFIGTVCVFLGQENCSLEQFCIHRNQWLK